MTNQWRKFAPYGLYISLVAALFSAGYSIVTQKFDLPIQISLGITVIGLALAVILDPERARMLLTGRQARYGSNALILGVAFLGLVIVLNFIIYKNPKRWDITEDKTHTLAAESIAILDKLSVPVTAEAYYTKNTPSDSAKLILDSYKYAGKGKFDYKIIDPDANPVAAQKAGITRDGTIILIMGDLKEPVTFASEQEISSALVRLTNPGSRTVYLLTGHGELSPDGSAEKGIGLAKTALESKNYKVNPLNLIANPKIPEDALAIIIAGPIIPLSEAETNLISSYIDNGGSLVFLSEPYLLTKITPESDLLGKYLIDKWAISMATDFIIDPNVSPPSVAVSNEYATHSITQKLQGLATIFPTSHSVNPGSTIPSDIAQTVLIKTAATAWGEMDFSSIENNNITFDATQDIPGPINLGIAATNTTTKGRVIVYGDSEFAADAFFTQYGNSDLFINSVDWAAQQESLINLTPKSSATRVLVPPKIATVGLIGLGTIIVIPGIVIISGIVVWIQRKRQG
jgi:ABC-type uncharacterized transport system involved in gliding motility auxiliary subunit